MLCQAPDARELHAETLRKLKDLYLYDVLRANKAPMSWGLEARFPFLDLDWLKMAYSLDPTCKLSSTHPDGKRMEKYVLRQAFDEEVCWLFGCLSALLHGCMVDWLIGLLAYTFVFLKCAFVNHEYGAKAQPSFVVMMLCYL